MEAYSKDKKEVLDFYSSSESGLSSSEAEQHLEKYGENEIEQGEEISRLEIFLEQFKSSIVWVLIVATVISALLGEWIDATAILIILVLNAILGYIQEFRAEKSIEELKKLAAPKATVLRDGKPVEVESKNVVPGDVLLLETGDKIPADARILNSDSLQTQEAVLTGESVPVKKHSDTLTNGLEVGERKNMIFSGTVVTKGKGKAVVTETGMHTEMGQIADMIQSSGESMTPLQEKLDVLGHKLGILTLVVSAVVFLVGVFSGRSMLEMFLIAVSLAVAAIPEGLPAVITISLSYGVQRMLDENALVRRLPSVETLGSTTVICTDKTGTLTHNEMTVTKLFVDDRVVDVTGRGYEPDGEVQGKVDPMVFKIGALCNDSKLVEEEWTVVGDPTEGCLLTSARKAGLNEKKLEDEEPRIGSIPFDSKRKRMTTIHKTGDGRFAYMKGAPEVVLDRCDRRLVNGEVKELTDSDKEEILEANKDFSQNALRVLGFAYKKIEEKEEYGEEDEQGMVFAGLQGMIDPPREEVREAIKKCKKAGIKVIMVTGDHKNTALAIADELGIEGKALEGKDMKNTNLEEEVEDIGVFARVSPEHKLAIINALKDNGHIVAMTGDGVNDAPALKKSDIGVAMRITGTDVAKEASEMILTDDNFASIVNAVEQGRGIYDNIKKFVNYLLSSNFGEVLALFLAMIIGFTGSDGNLIVPFLALQLLWINLVTDSLPALALGVDPPEKDIMSRKPRDPEEKIINSNMAWNIGVIGVLIAIPSLVLFDLYLPLEEKARTMATTSLVVMEIVRLQMIRQSYHVELGDNPYLIWSVLGVLTLQFIAVYTPLNSILGFVPLELVDWALVGIGGALMLIVGLGASGLIKRWTHKRD